MGADVPLRVTNNQSKCVKTRFLNDFSVNERGEERFVIRIKVQSGGNVVITI